MPYEIKFVPERRLSLKMLGNKVRRGFPKLGYPLMLHVRFALFCQLCSNNSVPKISYSDGSWINRKTTADLRRITEFLVELDDQVSVLQIGIGNSSLFSAIGDRVRRFVGVTVVEDEISYAKRVFASEFGSAYEVFLMNKYSHEVGGINGGFDFIVDNDISSYACCKYHFGVMLDEYRGLLAPGGCVLIGIDGLGYFDAGFGLTKRMIGRIAAEHGLHFQPGKNFHKLLAMV